jgi:hypothetical protein
VKIAYIRWHDAHYVTEETELDQLGESPCELHEVGFLLKETETHITIGTEYQEGSTSARMTLTIPVVNIQELRVTEVDRAFPKRRKR